MEQLFGILLHSIGGFSSASFYVPSHKLKHWAWETYWITLGFVAWIVMPPICAMLTTNDVWDVLHNSPWNAIGWSYFFGVMWGFGGLMCGLSLRFAGLSLGQSISLGVCAIVGTLVPAIIDEKVDALLYTKPGNVVLLGFFVCVCGIACCGYAGFRKENQLTDAQKKEAVKDFSMMKGLILAILGGIMSASMALALKKGAPIAEASLAAGTQKVFMNNPIFISALAGGFTTNFFSTMILSVKNKSFGDYVLKPRSTLCFNYFLAIISGMMWYGQYFFYGMGTTKMGKFDFASWSIHMATIIIFSNLWGLWLKEWKLVDSRTRQFLWLGIVALIVSVVMIGVGNYYAGQV
jgi:L-rhamnose-H+ transport protein